MLDQGHDIHIYAEKTNNDEPIHPIVSKYNLLNKTIYRSIPSDRWLKIKSALFTLLKTEPANKLLLLRTLNFFKYGKSVLSLDFFFRCVSFLNAPHYDIIHAHFGYQGSYIIKAQDAGFLKNIPLITTFHGFDINPNELEHNKRIYKSAFKHINLITANSNFTINLLKDAGCPVKKLVKLPVSLDTSFFKKRSAVIKMSNIINIAFCGRFIKFKAPDLVVEIAKHIVVNHGYTNVKFHLVGNGPLKQTLEDKIAEYGLQNHIILHGSLVQEQIISLLSDMDIFLYPGINDAKSGRAENQGLVLQEAQALELPVITSNVGGIPEGVLDKKTGFIIPENEVDEFVRVTELLINDQQLREKMSQAAREYVVKNFDNQVLGKKLEYLYYSLIKN